MKNEPIKTRAEFRSLPIISDPILPSMPYMARLAKTLISISEGIIKKIIYKRRDYE